MKSLREMEEGNVIGERRRQLRQRDVKRLQPCFDFACHVASGTVCPAIGLDHRANMAVLQAAWALVMGPSWCQKCRASG